MTRLTTLLTTFAGVAAVLSVMLSPVLADGVRSKNCVFVGGSLSCATKWQRWEPQARPQPTEQELAEARERERIWQARCRPDIWQDDYGVRRYVYAAPGCEYGKIE